MNKLIISAVAFLLSLPVLAQEIITENGRVYKTHVVEKGEGLYRISLNNNVTQEEIIVANPELKTTGLVVGMKIKIPLKEVQSAKPNVNYTTHVVASGETAYSISKKYDMSLGEFYSLNPDCVAGVSEGRAVKVKSSDKPVVRGYRMHVIQQGETLYSIGVKYGVKASDILAVNQSLDVNAMPVGTHLRIPDTAIPVEDVHYYYHHVSSGETLFSLAVKYDIGQDKITEANPDINWQALQVGQVVAVPKKDVYTTTYKKHEVERKETLFGITHMYGITEAQLAEANPDIDIHQLQKGQVLTIPQFVVDNSIVSPATVNPAYVGTSSSLLGNEFYTGKSEINVGLMLPFNAESELNAVAQKRLAGETPVFKTFRYIEFYQGVKMAVDSLRQTGTKVNLHVYDTSNRMTLAEICNMQHGSLDLVIGPGKSDEMHSVAEMVKINRIPVVLPFSQMDSTINDNPYLFQASVIDTLLCKSISRRMIVDCVGKNVIMLNSKSQSRIDMLRCETMKAACTELGVECHQYTFNVANSEEFLNLLSADKDNVILIPTTSEAQLNSIIVAVASVIDTKKTNSLSVYGLGEWLTFQTIEVDVFHKLNTRIYTTFAVDYNDETTQRVMQRYRKTYSMEPVAFTPYFQKVSGLSGFSLYALWGYDIAMKFISAEKQYGDNIIPNINNVKVPLVQSNFKFVNLTNWGGQANVGLRTVSFLPDQSVIVKNIE